MTPYRPNKRNVVIVIDNVDICPPLKTAAIGFMHKDNASALWKLYTTDPTLNYIANECCDNECFDNASFSQ